MAVPSGIFVVGTDTNVGKTAVACALLRMLREHGIDAVGFKPVATGVECGRWLDAELLCATSEHCEPVETICPQRFAMPLAPVQAARREGRTVDLQLAREKLGLLLAKHSFVVAEGIGGLLVPLDERTLSIDFVKQTGFPALVVARAVLGTVNHTLLSVQALQKAQIPICGIVINVTQDVDAENVAPSREEIERHTTCRVIAVCPYNPYAYSALRLNREVLSNLGIRHDPTKGPIALGPERQR